jgi:hypothetical protein
MENTDIVKHMDSDRWLLNNGLVSDSIKNQLFFCGSIVHKDVAAVEVRIEPENKLVDYIIYVPPQLLKKIAKYNTLSVSKSLFGMWRFKRLLKQEGCLDFQKVLNSFVLDYCGPKWSAKAAILSFDSYVDSLSNEVEDEADGRSGESDRSPDNG